MPTSAPRPSTPYPMPELLLPAGDPTKLMYAIAYGADAVYLGLAMASLRTPSKGEQFTPQNFQAAIDQCHAHGVKAYVTLNIFAANHDLKRLQAHLEQLEAWRPDALIISDPGVIRLAKQVAPSIPIHVSTQANVLNVSACAFWQEYGAERVILAREVPVRDMAQIHEALPDLELECFIHGSLCVAYSGRCVISDYLTDNTKNSNKGMCGNSCRWEFETNSPLPQLEVSEKSRPNTVYTFEEDQHGSYMLNSKDLCLVRYLPELIDAGICSFKVEGRTKSLHYVATVGRTYRQALDYYGTHGTQTPAPLELVDRWESELKQSASRGFTEGFLHGKPGSQAYTYETSKSSSDWEYVALAQGPLNESGLLQLEGRNHFTLEDTLEWMTPEGTTTFKPERIVDARGFEIKEIHPNHPFWVVPPSTFSPNTLPWSFIRRYQPQGEAVPRVS